MSTSPAAADDQLPASPPPVPEQSAETAAATDPVQSPRTDDPAATTEHKPRLRRTHILVAAGGLVVGLLLAGIPSLIALNASDADAQLLIAQRNGARSDLEKALREAGATEVQLKRTQSELATLEKQSGDLEAREQAVADREAAVKATEETIAANSFSGGLHVVGQTVAPGVYRTDGVSSCYYAWKSGTGADADIVDNNIVSGSATVTLNNGDVFESNRCGTWTKVG